MNILDITSVLPVSATKQYTKRAAPASVTVIHHSETAATITPKSIAQYHVYNHGWPGIGYHFVIGANGEVWQTNPIDVISYHSGDGTDSPFNTNRMGIGVCLVGDFTHEIPPPAQLQATKELIAFLGLPFIPHKEAYNVVTMCPGDTWNQWKGLLKEGGTIMGLNNIGLHVIDGTSLPLANGDAKPTIVKLLDPTIAYYRAVRAQVGNDCLIAVRFYQANQPLDNPKQNAANWYNDHLAFFQAVKGDKVVIEGYNEIPDNLAAPFSIFELERMRLLHNLGGVGVGLFSASVVCPDFPVWATYQPCLDAMRKGDRVCLHEYWNDYADIDNRYHCARWTKATQIAYLPIAITECGRDNIEGNGKPGWQLSTDANGFKADLKKYSDLIAQFKNVIGAVVFQNGSADPRWFPFDPAPIWADIVAGYTVLAPPVDDLLTWAETIVIPMNPDAGLCKYILGKGWTPQSQEMSREGIPYQWGLHDNQRTLCAWQDGRVVEIATRPN